MVLLLKGIDCWVLLKIGGVVLIIFWTVGFDTMLPMTGGLGTKNGFYDIWVFWNVFELLTVCGLGLITDGGDFDCIF